MIEIKDRIPTYPGRVRLVPVAGKPDTYDMVRADEPIEVGTPINKALFDSIISTVEAMRIQVDSTLYAISQRALVGDLTVGSEFVLAENGILVPYIKINNQYDGKAGSLVMRKDCVTMMPLMNPGDTKYENCRADLWLNNEFFSTLDPSTGAVAQEAIVEIRVTEDGSSNTRTIRRKVFLLSTAEHDLSPSSGVSYENAPIDYFNSSERKTAKYDGVLVDYYTRSIDGETYSADSISTTGTTKRIEDSTVTAAGIRPVLFLANTYEVTVGMPNTGNTVATAEVI